MIKHKEAKDRPAKRALDMDSYIAANPSNFSAALVEETRILWQPYYGRPLSDHEARELLSNVCNLFNLLVIARSQGKSKK